MPIFRPAGKMRGDATRQCETLVRSVNEADCPPDGKWARGAYSDRLLLKPPLKRDRMDSMALHVCCAPCLATAMATLRQGETEALPPVGGIIFYNPNIHPLLEFRRRVKALRLYLERDPLQAEIEDTYGLPAYLAAVLNPDGSLPSRRERCRRCYAHRLSKAAEVAKGLGYGAFSTTLLASREQDRDLVAEAGTEAGAARGVEFVVADLRKVVPSEKLLRGIYKQQYCGCIFSEEERYRNTNKHLYHED